MQPLPSLLLALGLLVSPAVLAEPPKHGKPGHDHARDHGQDEHDHAGHDHSHDNKPHHGGIVAVVDQFHHELVVAADGNISLYAEGLPTGDALKAVSIRLTILQGKNKQEVAMTLAADDSHRFDAPATVTLAAGNKVVAMIQLADGKLRMARFEIPTAK